jgi:ATP-binding cassette subfamily B protein
MPVRSHRAQRALKREHESLLVEWARSARSTIRISVALGGLQAFLNAMFLILLVYGYLERHSVVGGGILAVLYWGGRLPMLGQELVGLAREFPVLKNVAARLVEPLNAPEEAAPTGDPANDAPASSGGVSLEFRAATVRVSGKTLLENVSCAIPAGSHVAVVGRSGAGKSTLLGLALGAHRPETGTLLVSGKHAEGGVLERLRTDIAWVDPAVQLWNRSLIENVRYGSPREPSAARVGQVIGDAALIDALERLPEGMQTELGESGRLLSGGEGQRVRYARALLRPNARLVLLDEPFRGLERGLRSSLLARARRVWSRGTLLCVTHDISETMQFERVLVIENGRIAEDGSPRALLSDPDSLYKKMFESERVTQEALARAERGRRLELRDGRLHPAEGAP